MAEDLAQVLALLTQLSSQIKRTEDGLAELKASKTASEPVVEKKTASDPNVQALLDEQAETIRKNSETMNKFFSDQRKEKLQAAAKEGLIKRGIDPKRVELALKVLDGQLKADKTGKFSFVDPQYGGEIDFEEGLTKFAESENGGVFKAAVDVQGAGTGSFQQNPLMPGQFVKRPSAFDPSRVKLKDDGTMEDNDFTRLIASTIGI